MDLRSLLTFLSATEAWGIINCFWDSAFLCADLSGNTCRNRMILLPSSVCCWLAVCWSMKFRSTTIDVFLCTVHFTACIHHQVNKHRGTWPLVTLCCCAVIHFKRLSDNYIKTSNLSCLWAIGSLWFQLLLIFYSLSTNKVLVWEFLCFLSRLLLKIHHCNLLKGFKMSSLRGKGTEPTD